MSRGPPPPPPAPHGPPVQEVYLFAELDAEGRFARIEEITLMLEGAESDRDIGHMK